MKQQKQEQYKQDFINILEKIKPSKHAYEVFSDWLVMTAAALYSWKKDSSVEEEYENIAKQYTKEEMEKNGQLLKIVVDALEEKEQDFLGEIFTMSGLTNERNGQFFTPYHISLMMAKVIIGENELPTGRVCKISDPCSGAGGLLIAAVEVLKDREFNFQQNCLFVGCDVDARCARMAYIQLSLLGAPCEIYCMNTLTDQVYWSRETIGYHLAGMEFRLRTEKLYEIMKDVAHEGQAPAEEKPKEIILPRRELVQAELF